MPGLPDCHLGRAPRPGPTAGGRHSVTITGTEFTGATAVEFGTTARQLHRRTRPPRSPPPPRPGGRHRRHHGHHAGRHLGTSAADKFTYRRPPTVSALAPMPVRSRAAPRSPSPAPASRGHRRRLRVQPRYQLHGRTRRPRSPPPPRPGPPARSTHGHHPAAGPRRRRRPTSSPTWPPRRSPPSARPSGPAAGGTTVTITGTNFAGATAVSSAPPRPAGSPWTRPPQIMATTPGGHAGTVDVTVTTRQRHLAHLVGRPVHLRAGPDGHRRSARLAARPPAARR